MKFVTIAAAFMCLAATPALAKPKANQTPAAATLQQQDPYGVYVDGELIGRDPDPNVRASIRASYGGKSSPVCGAH